MLIQDQFSIDAQAELPEQMNYQHLKDSGIAYIQSISKNLWTDFNAADPGLTTLELLCYALTDLAYRTELPLADLLTSENQNTPFNPKNSYTPREIFQHNPLTINDLRKYILDYFPEIRNVWLYPIKIPFSPIIYIHKNKKKLTLSASESFNTEKLVLNGFYNIKVEAREKETDTSIIPRLQQVLSAHRNLCEDFHCVENAEFEFVTSCMDIDIDGSVTPSIVKQEIYRAIFQYCSPQLARYSFKEMLAKGYTTEEILSGPDLQNGYFDPVELANFDKREVLFISDIINLLMDIPGVLNIRKIHLNSYESLNAEANFLKELFADEENCLHLADPEHVFRFFVDEVGKMGNKINFYYQDLELFEPKLIPEENLYPPVVLIPKLEEEWEKVVSIHRDIKPYYSIQNEFPKNYLLGEDGISEDETEQRKVQRLQFKGFLLHFEQLMADYLAQLAQVKDLFSWNSKTDYASYQYQNLSPGEIKDLDALTGGTGYIELFNAGDSSYYEKVLQINADENFDRRNRFLNHMIARFNDSFLEFSIVEFFKKNSVTYGKHSIIADKKSFLRTFPATSANRLKAVDYKEDIWNSPNLSGFEMRVAKKLGLTNYITENPDLVMNHSLAHPVLDIEGDPEAEVLTFYNYNEELFDRQFGFHIIEHTLLRPKSSSDALLSICTDAQTNLDGNFCKDPYSFRITVVLPGWIPISLNNGFRTYVERVFREELPAHIAMKMCWVAPKKMYEFEKNYFLFMKNLEKEERRDCKYISESANSYLTQLTQTIESFENVYYPSHLVDCKEINFDFMTNESDKHPTILNQTMLNSKLTFDVDWLLPQEVPWHLFDELSNEIQYERAEDGLHFYCQELEIPLDKGHILKIGISEPAEELVTLKFNNGSFLFGYRWGEKITVPLRFADKTSGEWDLLWCTWSETFLQININKKVNFNIELTEINSPNSSFNIKIKNGNQNIKLYKIQETSKRLYFEQHDIEKIWFEKQYDPLYPIPGAVDFNISKLISLFLMEVRERTIKQNRKYKS